jgi:hypothetical protein
MKENKQIILDHLTEAKKELDCMISDIQKEHDCDFSSHYVGLQHIYHHLNTAWNIRNEQPERIENCSRDNFVRWRRFPDDFDMRS